MSDLSTVSTDLFNKIRSRFSNIKTGDEGGMSTSKPEDARFFDFKYAVGDDVLGTVNIQLDDSKLTVIYEKEMYDGYADETRSGWFDFLKDLRQFARKNRLRFDTRDIEKSNLDKRDYQYLAQSSGESKMSESKLFGTSKTSYQDVGEATIIVKHTKPVNYNVPAGRTQHIDSIYIESSNGERFKYPHKHLNGARAMARHIANGGTAYDNIGTYISGLSEELSKLRQFKNYTQRSGVMSEALGDLTEQVISRIESVKEEIASLQKQSHYEEFAENFKPVESLEVPEDVMNGWVDALTIRTFNEELKSVFPFIYRLVSEKATSGLTYDDLVSEAGGTGAMEKVCPDCHKDPCECESVKENSLLSDYEENLNQLTTFDYDIPEGSVKPLDPKLDKKVSYYLQYLEDVLNDREEFDIAHLFYDWNSKLGRSMSLSDVINAIKDRTDPSIKNFLWNNIYKDISKKFGKYVESIQTEGQYKDVDDETGERLVDFLEYHADGIQDDYPELGDTLYRARDAFVSGKIGFKEVSNIVFDVFDQGEWQRAEFIQDFAPNKVKKTEGEIDPNKHPQTKDYGTGDDEDDEQSSKNESALTQEVMEFIASMYDRETGTFPRGEEGVKIAVEKKFGEHAGQFANYVVEKLSMKTEIAPVVAAAGRLAAGAATGLGRAAIGALAKPAVAAAGTALSSLASDDEDEEDDELDPNNKTEGSNDLSDYISRIRQLAGV